MSSVSTIFNTFKLDNDEYQQLDAKFGRLCYKIFSELKRKNSKNNYTEELEDVMQDLKISLIRAGCYYKRQTFLLNCFNSCQLHLKDPFLLEILFELQKLWKKRTQHGAHRQCFGEHQEKILDCLVEKLSPKHRPLKSAKLNIDADFAIYCKAIAWNCQKNIGKKITRERKIRSGLVSLSEHDFLSTLN